jgi:hypothetical protein
VAGAHDIREAIQGLRFEIDELKREPAYGEHWRAWFQRACRFLRDAYGPDSPQLAGFLEIRFELGGPTQAAQRRVEEALPLLSGLQISTGRYYFERLTEADEYLLSLIVPM